MKTIDQRIADARTAVANAGDADKAARQAELQLLESLKADGMFTQGDFNAHDKKLKEAHEEAVRETLGMDLDEFAQVVESVSESFGDGEGDGDGDGDGDEGGSNVLERMQRELETRDKRLKTAEERTSGLSRELYAERVEKNVLDVFRARQLKDGRTQLARQLFNEAELVDKLVNGETLPEDVYTSRADKILEQSPEWFGPEGGGRDLGNGVRLKPDALQDGPGPGIPPTPESRTSADLSEADRAARATSVY